MSKLEDSERDFYVRFPLEAAIRTMMEVCGANPYGLYTWWHGRITAEYTVDGFRAGGVYGMVPISDFRISDDLGRCGMPCSHDQVSRWRRKLVAKGLVATIRTPVGHRTLVLGTNKFPDGQVKALPEWAHRAVIDAFNRQVKQGRYAASAYQIRGQCVTDTQPLRNQLRDLKETEKKLNQPGSQLAFSSGQIKVTEQQDSAFRDAFRHVDFPAEYQRMVTWLVANPQRIKKPGKFVYRWLANIPVPTPEPEGMDIPTAGPVFRG